SDSKRMSAARLRALVREAMSVVHTAEVRTVTGVDLDLGALVEEQRHLDLRARLEGRRLGAARGTVALEPRLGVGDLEHDGRRQLDVEGLALVRRDHDAHA